MLHVGGACMQGSRSMSKSTLTDICFGERFRFILMSKDKGSLRHVKYVNINVIQALSNSCH